MSIKANPGMASRQRIRGPKVLRNLSPAFPVAPRPLPPLFRFENHLLARPADTDLLPVEAELLRKPHRLASTIPKELRRAHDRYQYISEAESEVRSIGARQN